MDFNYFKDTAWLDSGLLLLLIITLLACLGIVFINIKKLRQFAMNWHMNRLLNAIGIKQKHNLIYDDGLDGKFKVDRLILLRDSILLISLKQYAGNIYCAERISEWTQVIRQKSYKFHNPLFDLDNQITTLRTVVPGITINGIIFFDHTAEFPKGHPTRVLHRNNIPEHYFSQHNITETAAPVLEAWETLVALAQTADANSSRSPTR